MDQQNETVTVGNGLVYFDVLEQTVSAGGKPCKLANKEFRLALFLFMQRPQTFTMKQLLDRFDLSGNLNLIRVYVTRIRAKVNRQLIDTPWGTGTIRWGLQFTEESRRVQA